MLLTNSNLRLPYSMVVLSLGGVLSARKIHWLSKQWVLPGFLTSLRMPLLMWTSSISCVPSLTPCDRLHLSRTISKSLDTWYWNLALMHRGNKTNYGCLSTVWSNKFDSIHIFSSVITCRTRSRWLSVLTVPFSIPLPNHRFRWEVTVTKVYPWT